jgi:hypothetical protein
MENLISKNPDWKLRKIKPLLLDSFYISMLSEKYKKSPLFWLKAVYHGTISNVKALFSNEFSSLIYIIEKNRKSIFDIFLKGQFSYFVQKLLIITKNENIKLFLI